MEIKRKLRENEIKAIKYNYFLYFYYLIIIIKYKFFFSKLNKVTVVQKFDFFLVEQA